MTTTTDENQAPARAPESPGRAAIPATAKRPTDRKPPAKRKPKPKVKVITVTGPDGQEIGGREVTLHGVTVTVLDSALGDFETVDDLSLIGEAYEAVNEAPTPEEADQRLLQEASGRLPGLLRRLVGLDGSKAAMRALRREHDGELTFEHAMEFISDLMGALGNS
jgi:hypothetical protein